MKKHLIIGLFLFLIIGIFAQTIQKKVFMTKYAEQWKQVENFEKEDLPKSASKVVDEILEKSLADKNTSQTIKALIYKNKYKANVDNEDSVMLFADLENLLSTATEPSDKAVLHSILAELYAKYYFQNSWTIDKRTDLSDFVPEDMKEWSKNIFYTKIVDHLNQSVKDKEVLLGVTTKSYEDIIDLGSDSQRVYPSLFDFLMNRAIDQSISLTSVSSFGSIDFNKALKSHNMQLSDLALPTDDFVKLNFGGDTNLIALDYLSQYLRSLKERNLDETIVFTELKRNEYLSTKSDLYRTKFASDFLQALEKKYEVNDFSIEVIDALVNIWGYSNSVSGYDVDTIQAGKIYLKLKSSIDKYPNSDRINILKNKLVRLEESSAQITGSAIYHPDTKNKVFTLKYKNLKEMKVSVIDQKTKQTVWSHDFKLTPKTTYLFEEMNFTIDFDKIGNYEVTTSFDKKARSTNDKGVFNFRISELAYFDRISDENEYEFYVVNRKTSEPIGDALVTIYSTSWSSDKIKNTKVKEVKTDSKGFAIIDISDAVKADKNEYNRYVYKIGRGGNDISDYNDLSGYYISRENSDFSKSDNLKIFTDRSIYRPGQTVYFKMIATQRIDEKKSILLTNKEYKVELYNRNRQLVTEKTLKTNDFGSLSGEFVLPQGGLPGSYRIAVGDFSQYISVEEYKRPTFQITFDKLEKMYAFGDKVTVIGHAENFSGVKIQHADVQYSIVKSSLFRWWSPSEHENIDEGSVTTKEDGSFEVTFTIPRNDNRRDFIGRNIFNFQISASVTDLNGETQSGSYDLAVGDISMFLSADISDKLDKNSEKAIRITAQNLSGQDIKANGMYTIYSVLANDSIDKKVASGSFTTGEVTELKAQFKKLPSAKYLLELKAKDDKGRDIVTKNYFVLYSLEDKKPPIKTNDWIVEKKSTFNESENAEIILGVSATNVTVLFDLMKGNKVYQRQQIKLSNENKTLSIPYKKEYGDNISVVFTYVIDEVAYQNEVNIIKKEEIKKLNLKWEVFRDKIRPGQSEEWTISVKDNEGKPAFAELLASMYDSSLDKLRLTNSWDFSTVYNNYSYPIQFSSGYSFNKTYANVSFDTRYLTGSSMVWDQLEWFGFDFPFNRASFNRSEISESWYIGAGAGAKMTNAPVSARQEASLDVAELKEHKVILSENSPMQFTTPIIKEDNVQDQQVSGLRTNFSETAFFYPQLRTNEKGETIIAFTVPESNTTWKFRALAYDKSLTVGQLGALSVSRKELMVTPNMPRFIRQGDKTSISTKISNLSDKAINGKVRIEFFDPLTDKVKNIVVENTSQDFTLEKEASTSATWLFDVPMEIDMVGCRIIAESESFSDGEQHVLSVLPNRMLVTESMTMNINGQQSKDFTFDKLVNNKSKSLTNYRLTLEYAANPAWYAIQALPVLSTPTNENSVEWFASYYANTLGASIVLQYPKVSAMIAAWKKQGGDKETLVSKLQKNEELKAVLLEETPWVLDAKNETEQMNRLSLLFDLNNTKQETQKAIEKLQDLQREDGGWSWYKGMYSSRSVTQYILYGFSRLIDLNAVEYPQEVKMMQINALKYIDNQIKKDFEDLKKYNEDWAKITSISTNQLEYLYVRSSYRDIPIERQAREAEKFYTSIVEKNWSKLSLYEKSLFIAIARMDGKKDLADKILQSIREYSTVNDEMGMFWANNRSNVFMSQSAIAAHTFIMDAFKQSSAPASEMDKMKQWLLKQKQTQIWESTHATIDAVYALLSNGSDWLSSSGNSKIAVNKQLVEAKNKELGTGYIKESWSGNQISNDMGKFRIEKSDNGPAWGAMYWQYYEDLDKITSQKGELNIDKKLFVEKNGSLNQVTASNPIKIGDKVTVRLTVRVDRDMEFVQLKDMRASCFEPLETLSGLKWQNRTYYYQSTKDASTNFFFDHLSKGTYVFEYSVYANRVGEYSNGITSIQCLYAPEFISHTNGIRVTIK